MTPILNTYESEKYCTQREDTMRKTLAVLMSAAMALSLTACGSGQTSKESAAETKAEAAAPSESESVQELSLIHIYTRQRSGQLFRRR